MNLRHPWYDDAKSRQDLSDLRLAHVSPDVILYGSPGPESAPSKV